MARSILALLLVSALSGEAAAKPPTKTAKDSSRWQVDDVLLSEAATGFQISPDGKWVVWVRTVQDEDKGERVSHLIRSSLTANEEVALTRGPESCTHPRWSPDGKYLAFLSARTDPKASADKRRRRARDEKDAEEPKEQVWLMRPFGGEPWPLTEGDRAVTKLEWLDNETILFLAQEKPSLHEVTLKKDKKDTTEVVEDEAHEPPVRLHRVNVDTEKVTQLTDNTDRIEWFVPSPDGRHVVTLHNRSLRHTYDQRIRPVVMLRDLQTGASKSLFTERTFHIRQVRWSPDSKGFYAASDYTTHPQYLMAFITELYHYDLAGGAVRKVDLAWERGITFENEDDGIMAGFEVTGDGFLALLADGAHNRPARYRRVEERWQRQWLEGEHADNLVGLHLGRDGQSLLYGYSTASRPTQWYRCRLDGGKLGGPVCFTTLNAHLDGKPLARSEVVRWKGALDEEVEGILYYPHDWKDGQRRPLVVMIHGGPMGVDMDAWDQTWAYPSNLFAARGAFVLRPNYHGSSNYGLAWAESIAGRYYELEVPDIEKGVDSLIARGLVDPERLGVLGWSNGGILTVALTVATTRYKAAAAGAGDVDWASDWGNCEFGAAFDNYYLGKSPLEDPQLYIQKSPFYQLDRVRTPTLICFGEQDRDVPTQQGWMHYRALQQTGKTDVRFLLFPDEKHSLGKLAHQRRKLQEELAWFDKYLFASAREENEALKPGSPLDRLRRLRQAKRDGGRYGVLVNGRLVPETVTFQGLEVGRFEVTRAQFAQFDPTHGVEPGRANHPASGIRLEQAQAYCAWLSQVTGVPHRLPDHKEAEKLYEPDEERPENTLDFWAGYAVNPDDAARLRKVLEELGGSATLLKEAGSHRGAGPDEGVFDLGGNVAEWVTEADGKGTLRGGCASLPADPRAGPRQPAIQYAGFRVLRSKPR